MAEGHTSELSADLRALGAAYADGTVARGTGLDLDAVLKSLNDQGWFLVRAGLLGGIRFTNDELEYLRAVVSADYDAQREEAELRGAEGNWHELEGPARKLARAHDIREKIGYQ